MKFKKKNLKFYASGIIAIIIAVPLLASCGGGGTKSSGYNVTYHAGDGYTISGKQDYTEKNVKEIELEPSPDYKFGKSFVGWYFSEDLSGSEITFPLTLSKDTNLYAKWKNADSSVTVKFDSGTGATSIPNYLMRAGESIEKQPVPTKENYEFVGWKENETSTDIVSFPFTPTKDTKLVASWKKTGFKVRMHTAGSQPANTKYVSAVDPYYETTDDFKTIDIAPNTSLTNATFLGWYSSPDEEGAKINFPYELQEDIDIYAKFTEAKGHTVTFVDFDDQGEEFTKILENCAAIPYTPPSIWTKPHYDFLGWCANESRETVIEDWSDYQPLKTDVTLYAKWDERATATINFCKDDGTSITTVDYHVDDVVNDPPTLPTDKIDLEHFDVEGWKYKDPETETMIMITYPFTIKGDLTLYSKLTRKNFDVQILNCEDGSVLKTYSNVKSIMLPISMNIPGREEDYKFKGYTFDKEGKEGFDYKTQAIDLDYIETKLDPNESVFKLYVQWQDRQYQVNLDYGDSSTYIKRTASETVTVSQLPAAPIEQHRRVTHYIDKDDGDKEYKYIEGERDDVIPVREMTLTAVWEDDFKKITVHRGGAETSTYTSEEVSVQSHEEKEGKYIYYYGDIPINTFSKTSFTFAGFLTADKTLHKLTEAIDTSVTEVWESWTMQSANATISYYDESGNLLLTDNRTDLHKDDTKYSLIKSVLNDYSEKEIYLNDVQQTKPESGWDDFTFTFTKYENEIKIIMAKSAFKVTYKSQCPVGTRSSEEHIIEHLTEIAYYEPPEDTTGSVKFSGWYYDQECSEQKAEYGDTLTKDTVIYGKWSNNPQTTFNITFNLGSLQMQAKFNDTTSRTKTLGVAGSLSESNFPTATCEGCLFEGWYDTEVGKGNRFKEVSYSDKPTNNTLYARWATLDGYTSVCLILGDDGVFTETGSNTILMNVEKNKTKWGDLKKLVPDNGYQNNEYTVDNWALTENATTGLADSYVFDGTETFLYPIKKEKIMTPSNFETDNWATISAVAENKVKKSDGTYYSNGLAALKGFYGNDLVGKTRSLGFKNFTVRVIGLGQDYGDSNAQTKLPITFEVVDIFDTSVWNESDQSSWGESELKAKINSKYLSRFPNILQKHNDGKSTIPDVYKYSTESNQAKLVSQKLFIPSSYEINLNSTKICDNEFRYTLYSGSDCDQYILKDYLELGKCGYWIRNLDGGYPGFISVKRTTGTTSYTYSYGGGSIVYAARGISLMFCLGTAY